jgi:hypothetical protein
MPSSTYNMKFKSGDFFYNTVDNNENAELLATFPFSKEAVIKWANEKAKPKPPIVNVSHIFDPQISAIILNPNYNFKDSFLPGNMIFNDNFNQLTFNLTNPPLSLSNQSSLIRGNIQLIPKNGGTSPFTSLEITRDNNSKMNWKQDSTNSWQPNFDVNDVTN